MSLTRIHTVRHVGNLPSAVGNARRQWHDRASLLLRIHTATGEIGQGEASPLPDYSAETLSDVEIALHSLSPAWIDATLALGEANAMLQAVNSHSVSHVNAARFAVETALLDALGQRTSQPIWQLFTRTPAMRIPLAQLLNGNDLDAALSTASTAWDTGVRCFKVKVGALGCWEEELRLLIALRERFGAGLQLRVDANRTFDAVTLLPRLQALAPLMPQFVEEPANLDVLLAHPDLPVSVGFDETLVQANAHATLIQWAERHPGTVFVLKPMYLGGFLAGFEWARVAQQHGAQVVISHLFDGPIARAAAAQLALALGSAQLAAGLGTHAALSAWPQTATDWIAQEAIVPSHEPGLGLSQSVMEPA